MYFWGDISPSSQTVGSLLRMSGQLEKFIYILANVFILSVISPRKF